MSIRQKDRIRNYAFHDGVKKGQFFWDPATGMVLLPDGNKVLLTQSLQRAFAALEEGIPTQMEEIYTALQFGTDVPEEWFDDPVQRTRAKHDVYETISNLRRVLGDEQPFRFITNEPGIGWMIETPK